MFDVERSMFLFSRRQRRIPILPDRFVPETADAVGDFPRRAFVGDVELPGGMRREILVGRGY